MTREELIFKHNPTVIIIRGDVAYDAQDNVVEYDAAFVDAEVAKTEYQRQRAAEYPSFADQFDLLYHGGYDAWKAAIDAVKTKYPKPE
jgi:hypothetical protein